MILHKKQWEPKRELNQETFHILKWSDEQILQYTLDELSAIRTGITKVLPECKKAAEQILKSVKKGKRVVTVGAGGSGVAGFSVMRELPQNHKKISPRTFSYTIAGGQRIFEPLGCENLEDSFDLGVSDIKKISISAGDTVILISATGRTPYTRGAAKATKEAGGFSIGIVCQWSELLDEVDLPIYLNIGPEIFVGATCEKAATAQKHVLDMIMNLVITRLGITNNNRCDARIVHEKARLRKQVLG